MITTAPLTIANLHNPQFLAFLANFDNEFRDNKLINTAPWCHLKHTHFSATVYKKNSDIVGVRVTSCYPDSEHLNFLYIDKKNRGCGLGQEMMNDWVNESSHSLLTIHVKKSLTRTLYFYQQLGFNVIEQSSPPPLLSNWITRCVAFNPATYIGVELMAMNRF